MLVRSFPSQWGYSVTKQNDLSLFMEFHSLYGVLLTNVDYFFFSNFWKNFFPFELERGVFCHFDSLSTMKLLLYLKVKRVRPVFVLRTEPVCLYTC